ncbi:MAG: SpoIVB peptidase S55 domain-containing protein [Bryobacteraceae bacterium]
MAVAGRPYHLTLIAALALSGFFCPLRAQAPPGAGADPSRFLPLADVRAGMRGIGKTVFSGTKVEEFQVEILGILENAGPKQSIILARLSGGPIERTGVLQGMSGSPVYIDGRLVGAVAMAFPFSKEPIAGIRPIAEMIVGQASQDEDARTPVRPVALLDRSLTEHFPKREPLGFGEGRLIDIATPVSFSGFTRRTIEQFAPQLRALGLEPQQGISGGSTSQPVAAGAPLEPGSMISVQLVSGDLSVGADGTVTHIDGNRIYAFGHRFLSVGATELPFARSSVLTLLPNLSTSFKISASGEWLGSITADHSTAVAGELGRRPRMVPLSITVRGAGDPVNYRMNLVHDRLLSPMLLQMAVYSAIDATERTFGSSTIELRGKAELENGSAPIHLDNMFAGDFNVPLQASLATAMPLAFALQNNHDSLRLRSVELEIEAYSEKKQMHIHQAWASKRQVRPGEDVEITTLVTGDNGREETRKVTYHVPVGAQPGPLYFTIADGMSTNTAEHRHMTVTEPKPSSQLISFLNGLRGNNKAYVRIWRPDPAYSIDGEDLPNPPPSLSMVLARTQQASPALPRTSKVQEIELSFGNVVISGSKTVQVEVKE